jgi:hypothetical protein
LVRRTSTAPVVAAGVGNAYDSDDSSKNWVRNTPASIFPHTHAAGTFPVVSGTPAVGAIVTVSDGLSVSTRALSFPVGGPADYATFRVLNVATGTWTVIASSAGVIGEIDHVEVVNASTTNVPTAGANASIPAWVSAQGPAAVVLSTIPTYGIVSGQVLDDGSGLIPTPITVRAGDVTTTIGADGIYALALSSGTFDVTFNPDNVNPDYVSQTVAGVPVVVGASTSGINGFLPRTARIRCFVSPDGVSPLGNVAVSVFDGAGLEISQGVTDDTGDVLITNVPSGVQYTIQPILDPKEVSVPQSLIVPSTATGSVFIGTFTISGAMGTIEGVVSAGGAPISQGTLIVASTFTSTTPPTLSSSTLTSFFIATTDEKGRYSVDVLGSTESYRVRAFYTPIGGTARTQESSTRPTVPPGGTATSVNISW